MSGASNGIDRARRFPLVLPLWYRVGATLEWNAGTTRNISHSGVLFVTDAPVETDTPIEMLIEADSALPLGITAEGPVRLLCHGRVVRVVPPESPEGHPALAATIGNYRVVRAELDAQS
jgi:hypothetical protein